LTAFGKLAPSKCTITRPVLGLAAPSAGDTTVPSFPFKIVAANPNNSTLLPGFKMFAYL
jgi:hypothetical protein